MVKRPYNWCKDKFICNQQQPENFSNIRSSLFENVSSALREKRCYVY